MALEAYRKKRDFAATPEPKGARARSCARGPLSFVVQKHSASHLHYDFRLELEGVLKSWAVPKGPSLDPKVQRLAVHVEDHPLEYGGFEGVIPKGEYGGGTVVLWDRGKWIPQGDAIKSYKSGKLKFVLEGEKLHGRWMLVRSQRASEETGKEQWLLIKEKDTFAKPGSGAEVVEANPGSVASGRTTAEVAAAGDRVWRSGVKGGGERAAAVVDPAREKGARRASLPETIEPELATLVDEAPGGDAWLHEIKFDGYRVLARVDDGEVRLLTRRGQDWTDRFARVAEEVAKLPVGRALFDGEVVVVGGDGRTSFQALQEALSSGDQDELVYYIFDLLYLDGYDLRGVALEERKRMLPELLPFSAAGPIRASEHVVGSGGIFLEEACRLGLEGILSKRRDSRYRGGRGRNWVKVKCQKDQEFVVGGFTDPAGSRIGFGALLLGVQDDAGALRYAGKVGTGFDDRTLRALRRRLDGLRRDRPPFADPPRGRGLHWVDPVLVAQVAFTEWTRDGAVRHPAFLGLREDKPASAVVRERPSGPDSAPEDRGKAQRAARGQATARPKSPVASALRKAARAGKSASGRRARQDGAGAEEEQMAAARSGVESAREQVAGVSRPARRAAKPGGPAEARFGHVRLSHPERVLYTGQGITKLDLARYYAELGELMVPLIARRPLMLVRCPSGTDGQCFFQKHATGQLPSTISRVEIEEKDEKREYMYVSTLEGVLALLNLGALELHTWCGRADRLDRPDRMIFDLDPDPTVAWPAVVELARDVRERLEALGLTSFVKTTGGKGVHIVVPLVRRSSWEEMNAFARAFADQIAREDPKRYTINMSKARRTNRIFIDYLRNPRGATAVEAYSTRARPGAPVSTPVTWDELGPRLRPDQWTVSNFAQRLKALRGRDPWEGYLTSKQALTASMLKAVGAP